MPTYDHTDTAHEFVSIVVPIYNEEESIQTLVEEIHAAMRACRPGNYEIILIDDGSKDESFAAIQTAHEASPAHVRAIQLRRNFGQTAAMSAGFSAARGTVIVAMDADLQNDPQDIAALLNKIHEGYDVVSGWRRSRKDTFITRKIPSFMANALISWTTGVHLHDYGCTLKAYRCEVLQEVNFYGDLHRFVPALASWAGARVTELPVNHRPRKFGTSKYGLGRVLRVALDLLTVKFMLSYSTRPMQVFGRMGLLSVALGLIAGFLTVYMKFFHKPSQDMTDNPWIYMCTFFLLGGMQLIGLGLVSEITVRTYYETQSKPIYAVRKTLGDPDDKKP